MATGVVVKGNKILVFSSLIDYHTSIEVKKFSSNNPLPAKPIKTDYEANLSIIEVSDKDFFSDLTPVQFENKLNISEQISILQLDSSGTLQTARGRFTGMEMENYPMGYTELPFLSVNSNEKLEGNGEIILEKDKAVALLYRFTAGKNSGKAIPGFVINKFLTYKLTPGRSSVFPYKGFKFRSITDSATREYYGLEGKTEGVLVAEILANTPAENLLQLGDIITEMGGMKIDSNGYFKHPLYGKQYLSFLTHNGDEFGFSTGKKIPLKVLRDKKEISFNLPLRPFPYDAVKIPYMNYQGKEPEYLIKGGFIFGELSEFMLREFGSSWRSRVDKKLLYLNDFHKHHKKGGKGHYVLLIQVLPDDSNNGYHNLSFDLIKKADGKEIGSVRELEELINSSKDQYFKIELENGIDLVLDREKLPAIDDKIQKKFGIYALKNF